MPTIVPRAPRPIGGAIDAFTQNLLAGMQMRRGADEDERRRQLFALQLAAAQREQAEADQVRSVVPQIIGAQPQHVEVAPARPPMLTETLPAGQDPEAAAFLPRTLGNPAVTRPMLSMGGVTQQIGPEAMSLALRRPEGRAALQAKGVITDEEAERRKRRFLALEDSRTKQAESWRRFEAGDLDGGLLHERAASQAMAEAVDDPSPFLHRASDLSKTFFALRKDKEQARLAGQDLQKIVGALGRFQKERSFEAYEGLQTAILGAESDLGRKRALELVTQIAQGKLDDIKFLPFQQIEQRVATILNEQSKAGQAMDRQAALRQAFTEDPQAAAQIIGGMVATGKVPDDYAMVMFGAKPPKTVYEEADQAAKAEGLVPGDQRYAAFVTKFIDDTEKRRKGTARVDPTTRVLLDQERSLTDRERTLSTELARRDIEATAKAYADRELTDVRAQLAGIRKRKRDLGIAPDSVEQPKIAVASPPPRDKNLQRLAPGAPDYRTAARQEAQRLAAEGFSADDIAKAMTRAGWQE